jgi:hypothetical protein
MCEELNPHGVVFRGCREPVDAGSLRLLGRRLAREARTDLHALSELVEGGFPAGLAVPVSAPLQDRKLA